MILPDDIVVVGVSGGADSMALLHVLLRMSQEIKLHLFAVHIEHGIRGKPSEEDALFVEEYCRKNQVPCEVRYMDVKKIAREQKMTLEQAGRAARYQVFDEVAERLHAQKIAVAHHMDDQAETILLHLLRGSGLKGLVGMEPIREGRIIRPFIGVSRQQILDYCHAFGIPYRTDHTNFDTQYTRNRVRLELIPYLEKHFNPEIRFTLSRTSDILRVEEDFLEQQTASVYADVVRKGENGLRIILNRFALLHKAMQRRIIRMLVEELAGGTQDVELRHIEEVIELCLQGGTGQGLDMPGGVRVTKGYDHAYFSRMSDEKEDFCYPIPKNGQVSIPSMHARLVCSVQEGLPPDLTSHGPYVQYFDADRWPEDAVIRFRRNGDRIHPLGSPGSKKLKDYFIDRKIDRWERDKIPIIASGSQVLWVVGYDIGDTVKITESTHSILKMEFVQ